MKKSLCQNTLLRKFYLARYLRRSGFSLIETLITILIIIGSLSTAISLVTKGNELSKGLEIVTGVTMIRSNLYNILSSDLAWKATIENSSALACVKNNTDCSAQGGSFAIYSADGSLFYDPSNPQNGFNLKGAPCNQFDATNGTLMCPYRINTNWTPVCDAAATDCTVGNVLFRLNFTFQISVPANVNHPINTNRFNIQIFRNKL